MGAAMNQDLLAAVSPAIILVEEASEVMEPQLIALLPQKVQHLILVGDHKQLRPHVACHELKRHNLAVSVLERLIEYNKLPYSKLLYQARMREEFVPLLLNIYPGLKSDVVAVNGENNRPPNGIASTMYFWNHSVDEITGRSPANKHEAHMVIALFRWLISVGHKHEEITILCAYRAQVLEIEAMAKESLLNEKVPICVQTIDKFQGSENQIIIASLVRSNEEGRIGHLFEQNRYCVTVSRARSGFYMCGNAKTLSQISPDWKYLVRYLSDQKLLGEQINLVCPRHTCDPPIPLHSDHAQNFSPNICTKPCGGILACGHCCSKPCHSGGHALCTIRVPYVFPDCQHSTMKLCSASVTNLRCMKLVSIILDKCGHTKKCMCWQKTQNVPPALVCRLPCEKTLACGHPCSLFCFQPCGSKPCPTCATSEGRKEQQVLTNPKQANVFNIDCLIKKPKSKVKVGGARFKSLQEGEASAQTEIIKEQDQKKLLENQIKENLQSVNSQIKLKSEPKVRLSLSTYLQGQGDATAGPSLKNLVKDKGGQTVRPADTSVRAVNRNKKSLNIPPNFKHFSTTSAVWKSRQNAFELPSGTKTMLSAVRYKDATLQKTHQRAHSSQASREDSKLSMKQGLPFRTSTTTTKTTMQNEQMGMHVGAAAKQDWPADAWVRLRYRVAKARKIADGFSVGRCIRWLFC